MKRIVEMKYEFSKNKCKVFIIKETIDEAKEITNSKHKVEETSTWVSNASVIIVKKLVIMKRIVEMNFEFSHVKGEEKRD